MKKRRPTILVTGSKGQVGMELQTLANHFPDFDYIFVDIDELDITNPAAVNSFFKKNSVDYCINCAAYTAVDTAETETNLAWKVNTIGPENLSVACAANNSLLLHISTDYVYHTQQTKPYIETDFTNPQGTYARTKLNGDEAVLKNHPGRALVLRTSWIYSSFGNNFVKTMLRLGAEKEELSVIYDQIGTPTYARDLAQVLLGIVKKIENQEVDKKFFTGVYHFSNEGVTSWYDFAVAIFDIKKMPVKVHPIETRDYPTPAKRPPYSVLNKAKIKNNFGIQIAHWQQSLRECLELL
ncbi:MAG: dTDP-4-dehydrorhamnose reductase [Saprospiraceae bacterium]|nr:dTDP-4-dehydrorhamnose reductase [Saprospiraceae bacterium]MCF8249713.1 dTDP-4-dehydrorhamnose reductase [Saprospiraceae bacterium]MCF8282499.1 dTDP-4-dehydrorhamnose reductase [Bacteroidales bacterium]MCF8314084.1 dTDP-4-dehydrorhamnose reductase [Saprospiraceae bacterium]MCF8442829.1 dTDP-4-dehydrorhamnose reductase [Saprospiraceae bacterium]